MRQFLVGSAILPFLDRGGLGCLGGLGSAGGEKSTGRTEGLRPLPGAAEVETAAAEHEAETEEAATGGAEAGEPLDATVTDSGLETECYNRI